MTQHPQQHEAPKVGDKVRYTGPDGRQHDATIDRVDGEHVDVTAHVDGAHQAFTAVPHSPSGGVHTWAHHNA